MPSSKKIIFAAILTLTLLAQPLAALADSPATGPYYAPNTSPSAATNPPASQGWGNQTNQTVNGGAAPNCASLTTCAGYMMYVVGPGFASYVAAAGAYFFDYVVKISLNSTAYALDFITTSWTLLLSLGNMFFIFILIYLAFIIMLRAETARTMQILAWVIAMALLINFSFFFTRVVIDAGNILGTQFYNGILTELYGKPENAQTLGATNGTGDPNAPVDITQGIAKAIGAEQLLGPQSFSTIQSQLAGDQAWGTLIILFVIFVATAAMFWMLGLSLIMVGIKFFIRIVGLWLVIIVSPLAFIANALPQTRPYFNMWLKTLVGFSFYAPVFLLMFYILNLFVTSLAGNGTLVGQLFNSTAGAYGVASGATPTYVLVSGIANVAIRMTFVIAMIYIMLKVSDWVMEQSGGMAMNFMNRWSGAIAGAGFRGAAQIGAFAGRNVPGRIAHTAAETSAFKNWAGNSRIGNALWRGTANLGKATYDVRNTPGGSVLKKAAGFAGLDINTGTATKRNFDKIVSDKAKRDEEIGKKLKATDTEAILRQKQYMQEYENKNGRGSYARRMAELESRTQTASRLKSSFAEKSKKTSGSTSAEYKAKSDKAAEMEKTLKKEADEMKQAGKKAAESDAKMRINQFADRLQKSPSWGHALGAIKVRKLVTEKSKAQKLEDAVKEAAKAEEAEEGGAEAPAAAAPSGGGGGGGGGGSGGAAGGHGPTAGGGGSAFTREAGTEHALRDYMDTLHDDLKNIRKGQEKMTDVLKRSQEQKNNQPHTQLDLKVINNLADRLKPFNPNTEKPGPNQNNGPINPKQ